MSVEMINVVDLVNMYKAGSSSDGYYKKSVIIKNIERRTSGVSLGSGLKNTNRWL